MHQIQKPANMSKIEKFNEDNQISLIRQARNCLMKLGLEERNGSTKQSIVVRLRVDEKIDSNVPTPKISYALSQGVKKEHFHTPSPWENTAYLKAKESTIQEHQKECLILWLLDLVKVKDRGALLKVIIKRRNLPTLIVREKGQNVS